MNLVKHALDRLEVDMRTLSILLGMSQSGKDKVARWCEDDKSIPPHIRDKLLALPNSITFPKPENGSFKFIDLFAGIGGIRLPFQKYGGECVLTSEWDKHSQITYAANFGEAPEGDGDITRIDASKIVDHDVLLAGFPCQSFSQAGRRKGFRDTRGTMFFEIQRILAETQPSAFLLENVKQLKGHDGGKTLETILSILDGQINLEVPSDVPMSAEARKALGTKLDYNVDFAVLRARDFGVPQNRERIYIVGFNRNKVPEAKSNDKLVKEMFQRIVARDYKRMRLTDALEKDPKETRPYTISDALWRGHQRRKAKHLENGNGFGFSLFNDESEYCNTISARYYKDGSEILIEQPNLNPRKLTPREAANIQGFPKEFYIKAVSDTQAYRQFGNSVAVPVIDAIAREMLPLIGIQLDNELKTGGKNE